MEAVAEVLVIAWFFLAWALIVAYVATVALAFSRLRADHVAQWEALGRPNVARIAPAINADARAWLWSEGRKSVQDPRLDRYARISRACYWAGTILGLSFFAFMAWCVFESAA